jgi:hypothetical protein
MKVNWSTRVKWYVAILTISLVLILTGFGIWSFSIIDISIFVRYAISAIFLLPAIYILTLFAKACSIPATPEETEEGRRGVEFWLDHNGYRKFIGGRVMLSKNVTQVSGEVIYDGSISAKTGVISGDAKERTEISFLSCVSKADTYPFDYKRAFELTIPNTEYVVWFSQDAKYVLVRHLTKRSYGEPWVKQYEPKSIEYGTRKGRNK